jgi:tRNA-specific 2-thiouridylase
VVRRGASSRKALVGLSGGVDSSVAAMLLVEQGYDVTGVTMSVYDGPVSSSGRSACYDCGEAEDIASASELAKLLGIPFHVLDCSAHYRELVLAYFRETYLSGRTPNPCVRCNHMLKFGVLPALAAKSGLDFAWFATGHYARTEPSPIYGRHVLMRGRDERKDQSYFLYRLSREQLSRTLFPLGGMTKEEVRALAARRGLPMHDRPDSQDFYSGEYAELLNVEALPGNIVDSRGTPLGRHAGFWRFTPGQRKGLGIAAKEPLYVLRVDAARNEVVVGTREESLTRGCVLEDLHFNVPPDTAGGVFQARMRSSQRPFEVTARPDPSGNLLIVEFAAPLQGAAPGQSLVLHLGDVVVGGGIVR